MIKTQVSGTPEPLLQHVHMVSDDVHDDNNKDVDGSVGDVRDESLCC